MHEMDTKVEATCPDNWDDSYIDNPDMIKEECFNDTIKSEPELEENDLHGHPTAIKDESVEHSDRTESEVEAIDPYEIKEEGVSVAFKSESELEGNELDDDLTTIKYEAVERMDGASSEIEAIGPYDQEDEDDVRLDSIKEESCEDQYEASFEPGDIDAPNEDDSDLASSISVKEEAVENDNKPPDALDLLEGWPRDWEGDDYDDFGAAVVLVPRLLSGPPNSGGAEQQLYEPEPQSPTWTSPNHRRKHGVADLGTG